MKKRIIKKKVEIKSKDKVVAYLSLVLLVVISTVVTFWLQGKVVDSTASKPLDQVSVEIDPSLVCMVNDTYMGVAQIPVPINGKTYYGCCQGCVDKLNNFKNARIAIDPYSSNPIDKSEAYIVVINQKGSVAYFESESNYKAFKKLKHL